MKLLLLTSMLLLVPLVAVIGSPVATDLPAADRMKLIYKDRFLIAEASNADQIFFNYDTNNTDIVLKNSTLNWSEVEIEGDAEKRSEGFVVETRPSEKGISHEDFCNEKSERLQALNFTCQGYIAVRGLNEDEREQIEMLKKKHANDQTLGPFKIVHDLQKTGRSPTIQVETNKLGFFQLANLKEAYDEEFFSLLYSELGSNDLFERYMTITSKVSTSSFVIEGLPKGKQPTSCLSTDLPYKVIDCTGFVRIRKIRDGE